ncbi:7476_t:CDS:2 [Entrophospora sp. SA101]|nr:7476_t:CDS:2 [Entrophospora sp. SA101]
MPKPYNKPQRRRSFIGQWDKTTKVVNVKQKYYVNEVDKYTDIQKATFTRWVNIQLRSIHQYDFLNSDNNSSNPNESLANRLPEIKAIDKDFRDGTRLIELLQVLYEGDSELPKCERGGNTRHHHIANVSNVLDFLRNRLDESGLAALQAIGPVDIVDDIESIESQIDKLELIIKINDDGDGDGVNNNGDGDNNNGDGDIKDEVENMNRNSTILEEEEEDHEKIEQINKETFSIEQKEGGEEEEKSVDNNINNYLGKKPVNNNKNSIRYSRMFLNPRQSLNVVNNYNKRMSLPATANKDFQLPPKRFRTLRLNDSSMSLSSSSGLLFWLNMQLIDYASVLPSSSYPIEDFTGLNDGVLLSALIHHKNMEWFEDFDLFIKDLPNKDASSTTKLDEVETAAKERLQKCFNIIEEKLDVKPPKSLVSILIENNNQLSKEQIKSRTVDDDNNNISREYSESSTAIDLVSPQSTLFDESLEEGYSPYSTTKSFSMACSPLSPLPPWSPKRLLVTAIVDWAEFKWYLEYTKR